MNKTERRKNYFIKRKFQSDFFIKFAALIFIEAVLIAGLFMMIARGTLTTAYRGAELTIQTTTGYFLLNFILITILAGIGIAVAGAIVFMYLTHRIGGPLYKFEKILEDATKGDISQRMSLRSTDQLADLKDRLNIFLIEADRRIADIKAEIRKGKELSGSNQSVENVKKLEELLKKIETDLEYFKTSR